MKNNNGARRSRGRGNNNRRQGGRMQTYDSNGPDVRIRGTAHQINEKYLTLAKDALASSDHVLAENYFQHAEHYQRLINELTGNKPDNNNNNGQQKSHNHSQKAKDSNNNKDKKDEDLSLPASILTPAYTESDSKENSDDMADA